MNHNVIKAMRESLLKMAAPVKKDFWEYVDKHNTEEGRDDDDGCWTWKGGMNSDGYGVFRDGDTVELASRVAYKLLRGTMPPDSKVIAHSCDNPKCVNPEHAVLTSQSKNLQDMHDKGRHPDN